MFSLNDTILNASNVVDFCTTYVIEIEAYVLECFDVEVEWVFATFFLRHMLWGGL